MDQNTIELNSTTHAYLTTPTGDSYYVFWDDVAKHVVLVLQHPGDRAAHSGALCVTPQSGNSIQLHPRKR